MVGAVIRSKTFQNWATQQTAHLLSKELKTKVTIAGFRVDNFTFVHIDSVLIADRSNDTVFYIKELTADLDRLTFNFADKQQKISLLYAEADGAVVKFLKPQDSTQPWNYEFVFDYFKKKDTTDTTKGPPFILKIKEVGLVNCSFTMVNPEVDNKGTAKFNPGNFTFHKASGVFTKFSVVDDSISFSTQNFRMKEKNGFVLDKMEANARIYSRGLEFDNLLLQTGQSSLSNRLYMNYSTWDDMGEFISKVVFDATLVNSIIHMQDVSYWGPNMETMKQMAKVNGKIRGPIDNMKGRELRIETGKESFIAGQMDIKGLPDFNNSYIDVKLDNSHTVESDLRAIMDLDELPEGIKKMGKIDFTGKFTGFPKAFVAYGNFATDLGKFTSDIKLDFNEGENSATYIGDIKVDNFDMGTFTNSSPMLQRVTFAASVDGSGLTLKNMDAVVKGNVTQITINNYTYKNIEIDGLFAGKLFTGYAKLRDENVDLDFDGTVDLNNDKPVMNFVSTIRKADLYKLHIDTIPSGVSGRVYLNFTGDKLDNLEGEAGIADIILRRGGRLLTIDTASLYAGYNGNRRQLKLQSNIVDAEIIGNYNFSQLGDAVYNYAAQLLPKIVKPDSAKVINENFSFNVQFKRTTQLTQLLWDGISVDPFNASGSINTLNNSVTLDFYLPQLTYNDMMFSKVGIKTLPLSPGLQQLEIKCCSFYKGDSLYLDSTRALLTFGGDKVVFNISVPSSITRISAQLSGRLEFTETLYSLVFEGSTLTAQKRVWNLNDESFVGYYPKTGKIVFNQLKIRSQNEGIEVNGAISKLIEDTLRVDFDSFRLANVNYFTRPAKGQEIGGVLNGNVVLMNLMDMPLFTSQLTADSFSFGGEAMGDIKLLATNNKFYKIISLRGSCENGRLKGSKIGGFINFDKAAPTNFNVSFELSNATTKFFEPFTQGLASGFEGSFSAALKLTGTFAKPSLKGEAIISNTALTIDYLQTRYSFEKARVLITDDAITVAPFTLKDANGSLATAGGSITHKSFSNFRINFEVENMNKFMALNTKAADNSLYFGSAIISGNFSIRGPFNDLEMTIKAKSEKGTKFNLQLADQSTIGNYDFITFVDYTKSQPAREPLNLNGIRLKLELEVTPDAEVQIIFDSQLGDIIRGTGHAQLRMEINTLGDFKMFGTYTIDNGAYLFTALDFINRYFTINKGGTITWTGDPLNAQIDLKAVYSKPTSVQPLVVGLLPDAELAAYSTPVRVDAILELSKQLLKPDIKFGLSIPDISTFNSSNANTSIFVNVLRRIERDQEEMSRQVFSMLSLGSLATPLDNGVAGGGGASGTDQGINAVTNNVGNLLSSQLTNLLTKYDPKWNIGVQVGQGSSQARTEVIISASRKLLNDRLRFDISAENATLNNISVSYNISPSGNQQVRVFSRNSNNPSYSQNILSNQNILSFGGGFYLRTEFENLEELKRKLRRRPKQQPAPPPPPPSDGINVEPGTEPKK